MTRYIGELLFVSIAVVTAVVMYSVISTMSLALAESSIVGKILAGDLPDCERGGLTISTNPYGRYCTLNNTTAYCERNPNSPDPFVASTAYCEPVYLV